ncbi:MAG TPA: hypothetical protein VF992_10475 [Thermoplasmata archaeon]
MGAIGPSSSSGQHALALPLTDLSDGIGSLVALVLSFGLVVVLMPPLIRKMRAGGMVGQDVNKASKTNVAELGGIAALFAFSVSLSVVVGMQKLIGNVAEPPFLAAISVFFMASMIGLIDDISGIKQRLKAVVVGFAALPLLLVHLGPEVIDLPFGYSIAFAPGLYLLYWLVFVPIGVTGVANAMNMSAGYNGLESGQIAIVSGSLLALGTLRQSADFATLIFAALLGCSLGLYVFNRFPAHVFIGDIGTLGLGAAFAAGAILGHLEFYGLIAIAPAFYEAGATLYFGLAGRNDERKQACRNPILDPSGRLSPPRGAGRYTLAYLMLSHHPMTERNLVRTLLALYLISGILAIGLGVN